MFGIRRPCRRPILTRVKGFDFLQCFANLMIRSERLGIANCALLYSPQDLPILGP